MKEIQQHPWYLQDLPEGVMDMNDELPLPGDDVQVGLFTKGGGSPLKASHSLLSHIQRPYTTAWRFALFSCHDLRAF